MHHPRFSGAHASRRQRRIRHACFQSILALTDLLARSQHAVERAARLAADHGALLQLMYAPASLAPLRARRSGHARLRGLGPRHGRALRCGWSSRWRYRTAASRRSWTRRATPTSWYWGYARDHSPAAFFTGQPVERLPRQLRCPVLSDAGGHAAALRPHPGGRGLHARIARTRRVLAHGLDADAALELFHALNTMHESKAALRRGLRTSAIGTYRHDCRRQAGASDSSR